MLYGLFGAFGLLLVIAAFVFDTAPEGTHNLGLLQQQMMLLHSGLAAVICGAVLYLRSALTPSETVISDAEAATPSYSARSNESGVTITRLAYAKQIGVTETDQGYSYSGRAYSKFEDAIQAAEAT